LKCSNCGHESSKAKLTLSVDRNLIAKARQKKINLSELMEQALSKLL